MKFTDKDQQTPILTFIVIAVIILITVAAYYYG
jgi:hypothetical protein